MDVERVVETGSNGYSWFVTFTQSLEPGDDTEFAFTPMVGLGANEDGMEAAVLPSVSVVPVKEVLVAAPAAGGPTYVRVQAANAYGSGAWRAASPVALTPATQKPDPPAYLLRPRPNQLFTRERGGEGGSALS